MNRIAVLLGVAGCAFAAQAQVATMNMLVSTDGGLTWSSSVNAAPGSHVEVLATASLSASASATIVGFGSTAFQPIVSNWDAAGTGTHVDRLSPILQGGNELGSMINAQKESSGVGSPNPYLIPTPGANGGAPVPAAPYEPGTYGRVYPMGRAYRNGTDAFTGFLHVNPPPDQLGRAYAPGTYLRIAQAHQPDWFNPVTNPGFSGIDCAQLFAVGRTTRDPDFWGADDMVLIDPGDPDHGVLASWDVAGNGHSERRQNVQLFRFGFDLSDDIGGRSMLVDAPIAGQQGYIGFYTNSLSQITPGFRPTFQSGQSAVVPAVINVVPSPAGLLVIGAGLIARRRKRV